MMFSETNFLAPRKDYEMKPTSSVIRRSSKKQKGKQTQLHQHPVEYKFSTPNNSKRGAESPLSRWWSAVNDPRLQAHDLRQQLPSDQNRDGVRILESLSSHVPQRSKQEKDRGKVIQDACIGRPYTWSDSAHSTQGYALQEHLLNILHCGLDISGVREKSPLPHASREYLDLECLKGIMKERQRDWNTSSSNDGPDARRGPMAPRQRRLSSIRSCKTVSTRVFRAEQNDETNANPGEPSRADQLDYIDTLQNRGVEGEHNLPDTGFAIDTPRDMRNRPQTPQDWEQGPGRILNDTKEEYSFRRTFDTLRDPDGNADRRIGSPYLSHSHRGEIGDLQSSSLSRFSNPPLGSELAELILSHGDEAFWHTLDTAYAMVNSEHIDQRVSRRDFGASDILPRAQDLTRSDPQEAALLGLLDASQTARVATMNSGHSALLSPHAHGEYVTEPDEVNRLHGQVPLDDGGREEAAHAPRLNRPIHPDAFATALQMELGVVSKMSWLWRRNQLY
ncbi:uncharacterized protein PFLUO_LOCUS407 [Penicillium psychrofluorescens]|uniref:uncharacterized protein n=1 Tax=Penicillium psychrofluorescens TaxID=3158075 RepID=UPI003CCDEC83